jgi:MFS family permease
VTSLQNLLIFPFYLQLVKKMDQQHIGAVMSVVPLALVVLAPIAGTLADKVGTRPVSLIGLAVILGSYISISRLTVFTTAVKFILMTLPNGIGMAIFQSPNNTAIMAAAPREQVGSANGMLGLSRTLGQLTGVSILGAFFARRLQYYEGKAVDVTGAGICQSFDFAVDQAERLLRSVNRCGNDSFMAGKPFSDHACKYHGLVRTTGCPKHRER